MPPKDWLTPRIETRFRQMVKTGALDEARANRPTWSPTLPSAKAIGAAELMAHLDGDISLDDAIDRATILTRQFAKRPKDMVPRPHGRLAETVPGGAGLMQKQRPGFPVPAHAARARAASGADPGWQLCPASAGCAVEIHLAA